MSNDLGAPWGFKTAEEEKIEGTREKTAVMSVKCITIRDGPLNIRMEF
jgi:hypothetical protein